jgi:hypothetical protein
MRTCSSSSVSIWLMKPTLNSVAKMCRVAINSSCEEKARQHTGHHDHRYYGHVCPSPVPP